MSILDACVLGSCHGPDCDASYCLTHEQDAVDCIKQLRALVPKGRGGVAGCRHEKVERVKDHWRCVVVDCHERFLSGNDVQVLIGRLELAKLMDKLGEPS